MKVLRKVARLLGTFPEDMSPEGGQGSSNRRSWKNPGEGSDSKQQGSTVFSGPATAQG